MIQLSESKPEPGPFAARLENKHEIEKHVALMARNRHPATRNRLPLDPRKQTFRLDSLTSVVDPTRTSALGGGKLCVNVQLDIGLRE